MKLTRTMKICYLASIPVIILGLYYYTFTMSLLEWEIGAEEMSRSGPIENWTPEMREKYGIIVHPYQTRGLHIIGFGAFAFLLIPTIVSQIASEVVKSSRK